MRSNSNLSHVTILLVDDSDKTRHLTRWFLSNFGYSVETAHNPLEALRQFDPQTHDVVITDNSMPGMTGVEMAHVIKLRSASTPVIMFSGAPPEDRSCLDRVILRPAQLLELKAAIEELIAEAFRNERGGRDPGCPPDASR